MLSIVGAAPRCDGFDGNGRIGLSRTAAPLKAQGRSTAEDPKRREFCAGRRPLARNARRAGENSRKRRVLALTDGHRKTPMQPGRRFDRRAMTFRAFTRPGKPLWQGQAVRGLRHGRPNANNPKTERGEKSTALRNLARNDPNSERAAPTPTLATLVATQGHDEGGMQTAPSRSRRRFSGGVGAQRSLRPFKSRTRCGRGTRGKAMRPSQRGDTEGCGM